MPKPLQNAHRQIIARANELGYFPAASQAKLISQLAAYRSLAGPADGTKAINAAIAEFMENPDAAQRALDDLKSRDIDRLNREAD